ncbi:MAG TPA: transporter substrate-binding domain-containing protein, partial [Clostridia bacterium]|nr:transporter substrate-binding domain-containing protein [Clostridia bacterium]
MLKICGDRHYPPFEFLNDEGVFNGFNVDLIQAIGKELNIKIIFHPMPWENALEAVLRGEYDAVQGMAISNERLQNFDFSEEYLVVSHSIFV